MALNKLHFPLQQDFLHMQPQTHSTLHLGTKMLLHLMHLFPASMLFRLETS
jgi:hypothetical protein